MIENKYLYFKTYAGFQEQLFLGNINPSSIVFIKDKSIIWTHDKEYTCNMTTLGNAVGIKRVYTTLPNIEGFAPGDVIAVGTNTTGYQIYYYNGIDDSTDKTDVWETLIDYTETTSSTVQHVFGDWKFGEGGLNVKLYVDGTEIVGPSNIYHVGIAPYNGEQLIALLQVSEFATTNNPEGYDLFYRNVSAYEDGYDTTRVTVMSNPSPSDPVTYRVVIQTSSTLSGWVNLGAMDITPTEVVQAVGESTTAVMSQKAVTDNFIYTADSEDETAYDYFHSNVSKVIANAVRYTEQSKTEAEKQIARDNIGCVSVSDFNDLLTTIADLQHRIEELENNN